MFIEVMASNVKILRYISCRMDTAKMRERFSLLVNDRSGVSYIIGVVAIVIVLLLLLFTTNHDGNQQIKAPYVGSRIPVFTGFQFLASGWELVHSGHVKVRSAPVSFRSHWSNASAVRETVILWTSCDAFCGRVA
jgi:hypothetical protein